QSLLLFDQQLLHPAVQFSAVFRFHSDDLDAHAFAFDNAPHTGADSCISARSHDQHLNHGANFCRLLGLDEHPHPWPWRRRGNLRGPRPFSRLRPPTLAPSSADTFSSLRYQPLARQTPAYVSVPTGWSGTASCFSQRSSRPRSSGSIEEIDT